MRLIKLGYNDSVEGDNSNSISQEEFNSKRQIGQPENESKCRKSLTLMK